MPPFTVELQRGRWGAVHFVYYQPRDGEEMIGELIEMGELSRRLFALIRREAEQWDGSRPSRSLLRAADWGIRWTAVKVQVGTLLGRSRASPKPPKMTKPPSLWGGPGSNVDQMVRMRGLEPPWGHVAWTPVCVQALIARSARIADNPRQSACSRARRGAAPSS